MTESQPKKKKRKKDEEILQQQIMSMLSFYSGKYGFIYFAPMNEIVMMILQKFNVSKEKIAMIMSFLRKMGWLPGVSDIIIGYQGKMYCIELKTEIGKQSKQQIRFEENCKKTRIPYMVVRSLKQCQDILFMWGIID